MSAITANLSCPSCQRPLSPAVLVCRGCDLKVEGTFTLNEFATLSPEDLHLLRIFILSEGRIRDMEAPLGLSYPTIRTRLKALRSRVAGAQAAAAAPPKTRTEVVNDILAQLQEGQLSFDEAMARIRDT